MVQLRHTSLLTISGGIWLFAGCLLLFKGVGYMMNARELGFENGSYPVLGWLSPYLGFSAAILLLMIAGTVIGYCKGKFVLAKSAKRVIARIQSLPNPSSIAKIYSAPYYILLAGMMGLGMSMNYFGIPEDVRGVIDIAVGSALINGSMAYFRPKVLA